MTIEEIVDFNKKYAYINCVIDFRKDGDSIQIENVISITLVCGFGDTGQLDESLHNEDWEYVFNDKWDGDGDDELNFGNSIPFDWDGEL